jgi:hypothetical protein
MKKEIKIVDKEKGVIRITTLDERWYAQPAVDNETGLPVYKYFPSTTWVASYYPKGIEFYKWLADKGWDEAEAIKNTAGEKGSKVHFACSQIDEGKEVTIESKFKNSQGIEEEISLEEFRCVKDYVEFLKEYKPEVLLNEQSFFSDISGGTIDRIYGIRNQLAPQVRQIWVCDIKTSKSIWEEYKLQLSDYSHMNIDYKKLGITDEEWTNRKLAILQIGYKMNRAGYKFTELEDKYDLFRNVAYKIWQNENTNAKPKEIELPLRLISPLIPQVETKVVEVKKINKNSKI